MKKLVLKLVLVFAVLMLLTASMVWHTRINKVEIGTLEVMVDINSIGIIITTSQAINPTGLGDGLLGHGIIGVIGVAGGGKPSNNFF